MVPSSAPAMPEMASPTSKGLQPLIGELDPGWMDKFMHHILAQEYDDAREVLRSALARGATQRMAEQYGKVLEGFLRRRDELENPVVLGTYGRCIVRASEEGTGHGLAVPGFVPGGAVVFRERALTYVQSPCSKRRVQVCTACLQPVGSLASQLSYLGLPVPDGSASVAVGPQPGNGLHLVPCDQPGCDAVFCSEACRNWALHNSSHAVLCAGRLSAARLEAFRGLERLVDEQDQEHLLLLAHALAQMLLFRRAGNSESDTASRFAGQFVTRQWDLLAENGNGGDAEDTPEYRRTCLAEASGFLQGLFAGEEEMEPFLELNFLSGLMGTFELVNLCIQIPHPVSAQGQLLCDMLDASTLTRLHELQRGAGDSDGDSSGDEGSEAGSDATEGEESSPFSAAVEAARHGTLFASVVGTALAEAVAFTNHSCLPNIQIDFGTAAASEPPEPGLWVHATTQRPLIPGDEVLMAYVPSIVGKPLAVRQRRMRRFGFQCRCRSCITDEMLAAEGDQVV